MPSVSVANITPARRVRGRLRVPGDKSVSHRYALLSALAEGLSTLANYAPGADCRSTLSCLEALGVAVRQDGPNLFTVLGRGSDGFSSPRGALDAGNSGTTMRLMTGILAAQPFTSTLIGDASLSRRPMRRVIDPLSAMGARIESTEGHAPLTVRGTALHAAHHRLDVPSAQVKSALLLAGLHADGVTSVTEPAATRDHTERAFAAFGISVQAVDNTVSVAGRQRASGQSLVVPGDFSSAAFWMVAAAALPGSRLEIEDVGLNPTRTGLIDVLRRFGARVEVQETGASAGEPVGTVLVEADGVGEVDIAPSEVPGLIDELPAIAALAALGGRVRITGATELRVKESDRIAVLVAGFRALGLEADELPDGLVVEGRGMPRGGVADAHGDHRMAMAFAIAALGARAPSRIEGADVVGISYPTFFETLERLIA